uniref:Uncharacterized protein n=1 Tax=Strigamia maritima TaxID=126957 RepID=T1ISJ0_STRMM
MTAVGSTDADEVDCLSIPQGRRHQSSTAHNYVIVSVDKQSQMSTTRLIFDSIQKVNRPNQSEASRSVLSPFLPVRDKAVVQTSREKQKARKEKERLAEQRRFKLNIEFGKYGAFHTNEYNPIKERLFTKLLILAKLFTSFVGEPHQKITILNYNERIKECSGEEIISTDITFRLSTIIGLLIWKVAKRVQMRGVNKLTSVHIECKHQNMRDPCLPDKQIILILNLSENDQFAITIMLCDKFKPNAEVVKTSRRQHENWVNRCQTLYHQMQAFDCHAHAQIQFHIGSTDQKNKEQLSKQNTDLRQKMSLREYGTWPFNAFLIFYRPWMSLERETMSGDQQYLFCAPFLELC